MKETVVVLLKGDFQQTRLHMADFDNFEIFNILANKFGYENFKEKQIESFKAVTQRKDAIVILPTGYGKSVIFQSIPFLISLLDTGSVESNNLVIIVTPLNSIIHNQVSKLIDLGIQACSLDFTGTEAHTYEIVGPDQIKASVPLSDIISGKYHLLYAHPEAILSSSGRRLVHEIRKNVVYLVVDEAHMIMEW